MIANLQLVVVARFAIDWPDHFQLQLVLGSVPDQPEVAVGSFRLKVETGQSVDGAVRVGSYWQSKGPAVAVLISGSNCVGDSRQRFIRCRGKLWNGELDTRGRKTWSVVVDIYQFNGNANFLYETIETVGCKHEQILDRFVDSM